MVSPKPARNICFPTTSEVFFSLICVYPSLAWGRKVCGLGVLANVRFPQSICPRPKNRFFPHQRAPSPTKSQIWLRRPKIFGGLASPMPTRKYLFPANSAVSLLSHLLHLHQFPSRSIQRFCAGWQKCENNMSLSACARVFSLFSI